MLSNCLKPVYIIYFTAICRQNRGQLTNVDGMRSGLPTSDCNLCPSKQRICTFVAYRYIHLCRLCQCFPCLILSDDCFLSSLMEAIQAATPKANNTRKRELSPRRKYASSAPQTLRPKVYNCGNGRKLCLLCNLLPHEIPFLDQHTPAVFLPHLDCTLPPSIDIHWYDAISARQSLQRSNRNEIKRWCNFFCGRKFNVFSVCRKLWGHYVWDLQDPSSWNKPATFQLTSASSHHREGKHRIISSLEETFHWICGWSSYQVCWSEPASVGCKPYLQRWELRFLQCFGDRVFHFGFDNLLPKLQKFDSKLWVDGNLLKAVITKWDDWGFYEISCGFYNLQFFCRTQAWCKHLYR